MRLVGGEDAPAGDVRTEPSARRPRPDQSRREVARANLEASVNNELDPRDPRWMVAVEAASKMEGSLLSFEHRRAVLAFAAKVGVRPFDANLIIAAVQDRARRGEDVEEAMPTVALTARPRPGILSGRLRSPWPYLCLAAVAVAFHVWLARVLFVG